MSPHPFHVVFLHHVPWEGLRHRSHQFAEGLADRGHEVLYVEAPVSYGTALRRDRARLRQSRARAWQPRPGVMVAQPPLVPPFSNQSRAARLVAARIAGGFVARVVREHVEAPLACLCLLPSAVRVLDSVECQAVAFDLADDYASWPGARPAEQRLSAGEMEELTRRSDVCFAVSSRLAAGFRPLARRMVYLPNGADTELFAAAMGGPAPPEFDHIPRPIVGFAGVLHDFFDVGLLRGVALARPGVSFVLVGPADTDVGPLRDLSNVYLLGAQPYVCLPGFVASFDVAVLPWKLSAAGASANPAKLWQYLSAGRPVVSTPVPEARHVEAKPGVFTLAGGVDAFVLALDRELTTAHEPLLIEARLARTRHEDWSARVDVVECELAAALGLGPAPADGDRRRT